MRGVPDVAGCADPNTGWLVPVDASGQTRSSAAPAPWRPCGPPSRPTWRSPWGTNVANLAALLYALPSGAMRDIVSGNNGTFVARAGYDCCTGLGVPVVAKLLAALAPRARPDAAATGTVPPPSPAPTPPAPPAPAPTTRTIAVSGTNLHVTVDGKVV